MQIKLNSYIAEQQEKHLDAKFIESLTFDIIKGLSARIF